MASDTARTLPGSTRCTRSPCIAPGGAQHLIEELQLAWYGLPYRLEGIGDLFKEEAAGEKLRPVNPLMQLPTLVLPDRYR